MTRFSWSVQNILDAVGGERICGDEQAVFNGVSIDSRTLMPNDLFVAIEGQIYDGHGFISNAIEKGGRGFVINRAKYTNMPIDLFREMGIFCAAVENTTSALADLASFNRQRSNLSVIAITGSNGKTSTRAMTASVVSQAFNTLSTQGNLNNEIGLPLTLFRLKSEHEWAVLELGMNHTGEIKRLAKICKPNIGLISNIGPAHLGELGSMDAIASAKGELLDELNGTAILNADDPRIVELGKKYPHNIIWFGLCDHAHVRAESVQEKFDGILFNLIIGKKQIPVNLNAHGSFMVLNALAAASVGYVLGMPIEAVKNGLENFEPVNGRMRILKTRKKIYLIDDTYNANPASMEAAIYTLQSLKGSHRSIFVAGDMFELGNHAASLHKKIGRLAASSGIAKLYASGPHSEDMADGAISQGMSSADILTGTHEEIIKNLKKILEPQDRVLVKGSRSMTMETVLNAIKTWADTE